MGSAVQGAGLPPERPVMAALVQSGLRNMTDGDADAMGFFQMRVGIWDRGEYAGYRDNPVRCLRARRQDGPEDGHAVVGRDLGSCGKWIDNIDRPGEDVGGHTADDYQSRLGEARQLLRVGCAD